MPCILIVKIVKTFRLYVRDPVSICRSR